MRPPRLHLRAAGVRRRLPRCVRSARWCSAAWATWSGRKYTFLVTILIMGVSTFVVGVPAQLRRPSAWLRRSSLIALRLLQGLALGGEYGGAATYVAEHAPHGRRGFYTSWIQTTATLGLFLSLLVILGTPHARWARRPSPTGAGAFRSWSRSCCSAISVWIRAAAARVARRSRR
jgi:MFS family permease